MAETFLPAVNGVVNSVIRVADQLASRGHEPVVLAPAGADAQDHFQTKSGHRVPVVHVPSITVPGYRGLAMARPGHSVDSILADLQPDVVHLASPALLGWHAVSACDRLGIPSVAVFQTDLSAYFPRYHVGFASGLLWAGLRLLHNTADLTLAPSSATAYQLRRHGIEPVSLWSRGVDGEQFRPSRRSEERREELGGTVGTLLVGAVGRLAAEKRIDLLEPLSREPGVQLVIVGDGPKRGSLQKLMPNAVFTGQLTGVELASTMASFDLLVHPGADETFCQVVQEALCSGVPVIAAAQGGPLDLVRHGDNGWLWAGDDPDVLAAQVALIRDDRAALQAVRARTRPSVVGRTWTRITDQLLAHYATAIASHDDRKVAGKSLGGRRTA